MKPRLFTFIFTIVVLLSANTAQTPVINSAKNISDDYVAAFKDTLNNLAEQTDNSFFKMHFYSMIVVIDSKTPLNATETSLITTTYNNFNNLLLEGNAKNLQSYLERKRHLIISWQSPTDGEVSFSWIKLPINWNPETEYPLYIELHGYWDVAANKIQYLTYPYINGASSSTKFEDGYLLSPWGRGNLWYEGISETDIWESIDALEAIAKINPKRKYICGHSMGGYGAWSIASKTPEVWAALGIHAGALWYNNESLVTGDVAYELKDMPTYFVCGTQDGLLEINQRAYALLEGQGNYDIEFVTFNGGHEYLSVNAENMYLWMKEFENEDWVSDLNSPESENEISLLYPNPTSGKVQINYYLKESGNVKIEIFNQNGERLQILMDEFRTTGSHQVNWSSDTSNPPGVYYIKLTINNTVSVEKVIII